MVKSKNKKYIGKELAWLEAKFQELQNYVDSNPIDEIKDRTIRIQGARGVTEQVVATVEQIIKSVKDVLKDLPDLLDALEKLKEKSQKDEISIRGNQEMPGLMKTKFGG